MAAVPVEKLFRDDLVRDASDGTDGFVKEAKAVQRLIKAKVPTGADSHLEALKGTAEAISAISKEHPPSPWLRKLLSANARVARQLGTLGGGNHFLEVLYDETGQVWLMLHSGSRWIGNHTAGARDVACVCLRIPCMCVFSPMRTRSAVRALFASPRV
eukprot:5854534-Pleurochrysis_carterae.AAC.2